MNNGTINTRAAFRFDTTSITRGSSSKRFAHSEKFWPAQFCHHADKEAPRISVQRRTVSKQYQIGIGESVSRGMVNPGTADVQEHRLKREIKLNVSAYCQGAGADASGVRRPRAEQAHNRRCRKNISTIPTSTLVCPEPKKVHLRILARVTVHGVNNTLLA